MPRWGNLHRQLPIPDKVPSIEWLTCMPRYDGTQPLRCVMAPSEWFSVYHEMIDTPRHAEKVGIERYVTRMRSWIAETSQEEDYNYYLFHARTELELTS